MFDDNAFHDQIMELVPRGLMAVKSEYETEGVSREELQFTVLTCKQLSLPIALKIGGCGAITDLYDCKRYGIDHVIAPMIESSYAVNKYAQSIQRVFGSGDKVNRFYINIETITGYKNIDSILDFISYSNWIDGITFGRTDYSRSIQNNKANSDYRHLIDPVKSVSKKCKERNIDFVIGGDISSHSVDFLRDIYSIHLSRFETRKCIFNADILQQDNIKFTLNLAKSLELSWLKNRRKYYNSIAQLSDERIDKLTLET